MECRCIQSYLSAKEVSAEEGSLPFHSAEVTDTARAWAKQNSDGQWICEYCIEKKMFCNGITKYFYIPSKIYFIFEECKISILWFYAFLYILNKLGESDLFSNYPFGLIFRDKPVLKRVLIRFISFICFWLNVTGEFLSMLSIVSNLRYSANRFCSVVVVLNHWSIENVIL
jgi:hypothetical protein